MIQVLCIFTQEITLLDCLFIYVLNFYHCWLIFCASLNVICMASQVHNLGFGWSKIKIFAVLNMSYSIPNNQCGFERFSCKRFYTQQFKRISFILQKEVKTIRRITWSVMVAELSCKMCVTVQSLPNHAIFLFFWVRPFLFQKPNLNSTPAYPRYMLCATHTM